MLQGEYFVEAVRSPRFLRRFWRKVQKSDGCWTWTACRNRAGYGKISIGPVRFGTELAHRASWAIHCGAIPDGLFVCHRCDNPPCVKPEHLFLGTNLENRQDSVAKGRPAKGSRHPHAVLSESAVKEIRAKARAGAKLADLGREYGVTIQTISKVCLRQMWRHVQPDAPNPETL